MGTLAGAEKVAAKRIGISVEDWRAKRAAGLKWCFRCTSWKLCEQFDVDRSRGDGLTAQCVDCRRVKVRRTHLSSGTAAERQGAHDAIRHAVKHGRMVAARQQKCIDCGAQAAHYHHHLGYERAHWLDVVAVCYSCHQKRHWPD